MAKARATILVSDGDDEHPPEYHWVIDWLVRSGKDVRIVGYDFRDLAHVWDVDGSTQAIAELPPKLTRESAWARDGGKKAPVGKMKFSLSRAKRLRNRERARGEGEGE